MIDKATFDVDGGYGIDGRGTRATLTLEGDFVTEFEKYLAEDKGTVTLDLPRDVAESIARQIGRFV